MRLAPTILLVSLSCGAGAVAEARDAAQHSVAEPATPSVATRTPRTAVFDQIAGLWDVQYEIFDANGAVRRYAGQVRYEWILDGLALQETWTGNSHSVEPRPYGTTIDFYDAHNQRWTAVWIYPDQGMTSVVTGGEIDGRLVFTGPDRSGAIQRWTTVSTNPSAMEGRFETSTDGGATWRLVGVNHMTRHVS